MLRRGEAHAARLGLFVLLIVAIDVANVYLLPQHAWVATGVLTIGLMMMVGWGVNRRPDGILIDNRNRVSLSKFQAAAWMVLVLSALVSAVALNLFNADPTPIDIQITNALLAAMGISATSLIASLPVVSEQFIWLLTISHAGYLVYKAAPHSRSAGPAPTPAPSPAPANSSDAGG